MVMDRPLMMLGMMQTNIPIGRMKTEKDDGEGEA